MTYIFMIQKKINGVKYNLQQTAFTIVPQHWKDRKKYLNNL